jgi:hypothetical protein
MVGANLAGRTGRVKREIESKVRYPVDMESGAQKNEQMLQWAKKVWKPTVTQFEISYLLLDCCTIHLTRVVKKAFNDCNKERISYQGDTLVS